MAANQKDATSARGDAPLQGREMALAILSIGAVATGYLLIADVHGALGIPRNDDWAYVRIAFDFSRTGHLRLLDWGQMTLAGQILLAAPILAIAGRSIVALQVTVTVLGALAVLLSYVLLRSFLPRSWSALSCAALLVGPLFGSLSVSFMTDVPAFFLETLTLVLGWRAVSPSRVSTRWLAGAAAAGLAATSIRDNGALAFGAVLLIAFAKTWTSGDRQRLRASLAAGAGFSAIAIVMVLWAHALPHAEPTSFSIHPTVVRKLPRAMFTLALLISPCLLVVSPRRLIDAAARTARWLQVCAGLGFVVVLVCSTANFIGNYFLTLASYQPSQAPLGVQTPAVVPSAVYLALRVFTAYALAILVGLLLVASQAGVDVVREQGWRGLACLAAYPSSAAPLLTVFLLGSVVAQAFAVALLDVPFFDRDLIGLIPFTAGLALGFTRQQRLFVRAPSRGGLALTGLVGLALIGLLVVDASAATDGARWALAEKAVATGHPAATIDGGFDWFGFHQPDAVEVQPRNKAVEWWIRLFTLRPVCVNVGSPTNKGPYAQLPVLATTRVTTVFDQHLVFLLRPGPDHCRPTGP